MISRRRGGTSAVVSRAPFDRLVPIDLTPWIESGDLLPGDVVRIDVRPPFHVVGDAPARELMIHGDPAMDAASLSTAPHATWFAADRGSSRRRRRPARRSRPRSTPA